MPAWMCHATPALLSTTGKVGRENGGDPGGRQDSLPCSRASKSAPWREQGPGQVVGMPTLADHLEAPDWKLGWALRLCLMTRPLTSSEGLSCSCSRVCQTTS